MKRRYFVYRTGYLSVYNVRFPANICEHRSPSFVRQPSALPGRGGGAIVVPSEKPSSVKTRKSATTKTEDLYEVGVGTQQVQKPRQITMIEPQISRDSYTKRSSMEIKIIKREAKNRYLVYSFRFSVSANRRYTI